MVELGEALELFLPEIRYSCERRARKIRGPDKRSTGEDGVYVNLYAQSDATIPVKGQKVRVSQETAYPWDGKIKLTLHPERPALRSGERDLSFAELNGEANRIAHVLRAHGVGPNVSVALCLERSAEMIVALLGVLKSGGCYVPLVPDNPKSRLAHQLAETAAPVLLLQGIHPNVS